MSFYLHFNPIIKILMTLFIFKKILLKETSEQKATLIGATHEAPAHTRSLSGKPPANHTRSDCCLPEDFSLSDRKKTA